MKCEQCDKPATHTSPLNPETKLCKKHYEEAIKRMLGRPK